LKFDSRLKANVVSRSMPFGFATKIAICNIINILKVDEDNSK